MAGKLEGKVAAVTGAGRGLGRAYAHALAAEGAAVVVNDVDPDHAQVVAKEIEAAGGRALPDAGSIASPEGAARLVAVAVDGFGRIDTMVTNAGADRRGPFLDLTPEDWDFTLGVHVFGSVHCATAAARAMRDQGDGGSLIIVTSVAFYAGSLTLAPYCVSKGGTYSLMRALSSELAPLGISVNGVAPPMTATIPVMAFLDSMASLMPAGDLEALKASAQDPASVAPIVVFLATDEGRKLSGQLFTMTVDAISLLPPPEERIAHTALGGWTLEGISEVMPDLLAAGVTSRRGIVATAFALVAGLVVLAPAASAGAPIQLDPVTVLDTRFGVGLDTPAVADESIVVPVVVVGSIGPDATAVVIDVTVLNATFTGFVTAAPPGRGAFSISAGWSPGRSTTARALAGLGPAGDVEITLHSGGGGGGEADVVVRVVQWYTADQLTLVGQRVVDSRFGGPLPPGQPLYTTGPGDVAQVTLLTDVPGTVIAHPLDPGAPAHVVADVDAGDLGGLITFTIGGGSEPAVLTYSGSTDVIVDRLATLAPGAPVLPVASPFGPPTVRTTGPHQLAVDWFGAEARTATVVELVTAAGVIEPRTVPGTATAAVLDGVPDGIVAVRVRPVLGVEGEVSVEQSMTARFQPIDPVRVLDTREDGDQPLDGGDTLDLPVLTDLPGRATAVVVNLTATETTGAGYVTAFPSDGPRPIVSNLNIPAAGTTVANLAVVPLSAAGAISLFTQTTTDLVVDVAGYWVRTPMAADGRLTSVTPARVVDTRDGTGGRLGPLPANGSFDVQVAGVGGVPANAAAVAFTLTATDTAGAGYFTARAVGTPFQTTSSLNATGPGQTIANLVIVPVGDDGRVTIASQTGGHVLVDVAGWFTGFEADPATAGLLVAVPPERVLDTRVAPPGLGAPEGRTVPVAGHAGVPAEGAAAVVANLTATESTGAGYVTAWPAPSPRPLASNLNLTAAGQTVPNLAITPLGSQGLGLYASIPTQVIVDVAGWFTR